MKPLTLAATLPLTALVLTGAAPLPSGDLTVSITLPRINSASYHRPYVAVWIERPDQTAVRTLSVWYDTGLPAGEGKDWLKDIRTWWRKDGRGLTLPADGVSGPTRAPGTQTVTIPASRLRDLPAGNYVLAVEAARELGGRELVRVPFRLGAANTASGTGETELGAVRVSVAR
ncbi:DUF2271 domain-containing protein [Brevundimonas sp. A19_0]|uniref:DUF2271 domain-containing protein n=1 Tax=Brevundimonas sp. A19_0 TaxID=2821087 RepID=UPI001ADC83F7|nr:DUF2271 domain-containing protein [Brevundimonas sp. A19_0]MBO9500951.1 DUF2271 domain-containing protein [Brevundimonas sp. A19_0]